MLILTAGCQGLYGPSNPASDERAVEQIKQVRAEVPNVSSYRVTVDGRVRIADDSRSRRVEVSGEGTVNVSRQRLILTVDMQDDARVGHRGPRMAYLDRYTLDLECSRMGWARYNLTESTRWFNYTPLGQQLALLDRSMVYWNGTQVVNGVETVVVIAHPTEKQLQSTQNLPPGTEVTREGAKFQNATVRAWINPKTDRVLKVQREIHVRGGGSTAVATVTFHFSKYNESTDISRPPFEDAAFQWNSSCPET